jgi:hypothetical protein
VGLDDGLSRGDRILGRFRSDGTNNLEVSSPRKRGSSNPRVG